MSLGNFFKALRAEKQVHALTLVQDNHTGSARLTKLSKRATKKQPHKRERPTLTKSILNTDTIAPKLPVRQESDDMLHLGPSTTPFQTYGQVLDRDLRREASRCRKNAKFDAAKTAWSSKNGFVQQILYEDLEFASSGDETKEILKRLLPSST